MAPIPVYSASPINAAKASGVTPKTAHPEPSDSAPHPATTTASSTDSSYPPARPGAAAVPAPSGSAQRYMPVQPTPTTASHSEGPPAPQPGALPMPPKSHIPPPPKANDMYQPPQQQSTAPSVQPYPPQMGIPPPTTSFGAPHSSTSTNTAPSSVYPVQIQAAEQGGPRRSIEHPPGYHQNAYASDMTNDQRRAQEAHNASSGVVKDDDNSEGIWGSAKKLAQTMGTKIAETEAEVWRRVNKQ